MKSNYFGDLFSRTRIFFWKKCIILSFPSLNTTHHTGNQQFIYMILFPQTITHLSLKHHLRLFLQTNGHHIDTCLLHPYKFY